MKTILLSLTLFIGLNLIAKDKLPSSVNSADFNKVGLVLEKGNADK